MKTLALVAAALAAIVVTPVASSGTGHSRVRLLTLLPLVVRGTGFAAHEQVVLTVRSGQFRRTSVVSTSPAGTFVARFARALPVARCGTLSVTAAGDRGDTAFWTLAARMCGGPLVP